MPIHHVPALVQGAAVIHIRVFGQDIWNHCVLVCLDNAGNDEKQGPAEYDQVLHKHCLYDLKISAAAKSVKQAFKARVRLSLPAFNKVGAQSHPHHVAQKGLYQDTYNKNDDRHDDNDEHNSDQGRQIKVFRQITGAGTARYTEINGGIAASAQYGCHKAHQKSHPIVFF